MPPMIRKADLENHNKDGGQWIVVHGHVYDLEDFRSASSGPMSDCGEDITKIVEAVASQGDDPMMQSFYVGNFCEPSELAAPEPPAPNAGPIIQGYSDFVSVPNSQILKIANFVDKNSQNSQKIS